MLALGVLRVLGNQPASRCLLSFRGRSVLGAKNQGSRQKPREAAGPGRLELGWAGLVPGAGRGRGERSSHEETETQIASVGFTVLADSLSDSTGEVLSTMQGHTCSVELQSEIPPGTRGKAASLNLNHSGFLQRAQHPAGSAKLWMVQTAVRWCDSALSTV